MNIPLVDVLFIVALTITFYGLLIWAFRVLPRERWQVMAAIPRRAYSADETGSERVWSGVNLTWYGFFSATAYLLAAALFLVLMGASGSSLSYSLLLIGAVLGVAIPASRLVAQWVEGKKETFSIGGAVFVAILLAPIFVVLMPLVGIDSGAENAVTSMAALAIAYTLGEGLGRLACISFGCCYGKPVSEMSPLMQRLFRGWSFTFQGHTKKIAFASRLEGVPVAPIQGVTATLYVTCALLSSALFLMVWPLLAFLLSVSVTQLWRAYSEFLRADYRGEGKISSYQKMAVFGTAYSWVWMVVLILLGTPLSHTSHLTVASGLAMIWTPGVLLALQLLWVGMFLYTGWSRVTGSKVSFHVVEEKVSEAA